MHTHTRIFFFYAEHSGGFQNLRVQQFNFELNNDAPNTTDLISRMKTCANQTKFRKNGHR